MTLLELYRSGVGMISTVKVIKVQAIRSPENGTKKASRIDLAGPEKRPNLGRAPLSHNGHVERKFSDKVRSSYQENIPSEPRDAEHDEPKSLWNGYHDLPVPGPEVFVLLHAGLHFTVRSLV